MKGETFLSSFVTLCHVVLTLSRQKSYDKHLVVQRTVVDEHENFAKKFSAWATAYSATNKMQLEVAPKRRP
jgi:hypothetical protein